MSSFYRPVLQMVNWLLPSDWIGYVLLVLIPLFQIAYYIWRSNADEFIMDAGLGLFFLCLAIAPFLLLLLVSVLFLIGATFWYAIRKRGHFLPLIMLVVGAVIAQILPLPPSPAETAFYKYRNDYETVVELARQNQLGHNEDCGYAFSVPEEYRHLTRRCVFIVYDPALAVSFSPPSSHRDIAYADTLQALGGLGSCNEFGSVFKKVETHWYICTPAQD